MTWLIFIPFVTGSIIGLAFAMRILARVWILPIDKPEFLNRIAQTLASGNREKALLMLEEDNHPISAILSFSLKLQVDEIKEHKDAFDYASQEMIKRLTSGIQTLAWLSLLVPIATAIVWFVLVPKPPGQITIFVWIAIFSEIVFWNVTIFYVKLKTRLMFNRANDHFTFLSGMMSMFESKKTDISGLVEQITDNVEISSAAKKIPKPQRG
jgi:hypothetical protein